MNAITIYIGDFPVYIGGSVLEGSDFLQMDALITPTDVEKFIEMAEESGHRFRGLYVSGDVERNLQVIKKHVKYIEAAGGAVYNTLGQLLLIRRLGKWDLPKGKLEAGESVEECAIREVEEECGISELVITGQLPDTYHMYLLSGKRVLKKSVWFRMNTSSWMNAKPQTEENIEEVKWVYPDELDIPSLDTYATIRFLLREL